MQVSIANISHFDPLYNCPLGKDVSSLPFELNVDKVAHTTQWEVRVQMCAKPGVNDPCRDVTFVNEISPDIQSVHFDLLSL